MQFIQLLENEWILTWIIIFFILLFILGTGRIAPKLVVAGMILLSGVCVLGGWGDQNGSSGLGESTIIPTDSLSKNDTIVEGKKEETLRVVEKGEEKIDKKPNHIPISYEEDFGGRISIEGISDKLLKMDLTRWIDEQRKSKAALNIEVGEDGSLSSFNEGAIKKYRYSGGKLIIKINGKECCCGGKIVLPPDQHEAEMKVMNPKITDQIHQKIRSNQDFIIKMLSDCL